MKFSYIPNSSFSTIFDIELRTANIHSPLNTPTAFPETKHTFSLKHNYFIKRKNIVYLAIKYCAD